MLKAEVKLVGDTLEVTMSGIEDDTRSRGRVCSIELAILRKIGHLQSEPWTWDKNRLGTVVWTSPRKTNKEFGEVRKVLKDFCLL